MIKVLVLEPYYGGSHRYFLDGLRGNVAAAYTFMVLPARKWKLRMQFSAPWFVEQIKNLAEESRSFDVVLCSTFVDVAVLRALLSQVPWWNPQTRILTYFHENQFAYPRQYADDQQRQFTAINFNSALASDSIAFNSSFNRDSFLDGCRRFMKIAGDMKIGTTVENLKNKSIVLSPGIDFTQIDSREQPGKIDHDVPVIVWNHRWEHDKNPEQFFKGLEYLESEGLDFRLIVLGESFKNSPPCFLDAQKRFASQTVHFGYAESHEEYLRILSLGDIVVSTAHHEFYGISVIEAVRAGCTPLLPKRLSYPELFEKRYLYTEESFLRRLAKVVRQNHKLERGVTEMMTDRFGWKHLQKSYGNWLGGTVEQD